MLKPVTLTLGLLMAAHAGFAPSVASAKIEDWRDTQGNAFRAEPAEALGPLAVFRSDKRGSRIMPFHLLSPEDCVRFYEAVKKKPARAAEWKNTKTELGYDFFRRTFIVRNGGLGSVDFTGRPEPRFFIVLYAANNESKSWESIDAMLPIYQKLRAAYPDDVEAMLFGVGHGAQDHINMAVSKAMPWLVADLMEEGNMNTLRRFASTDALGVIVFTGDGVPLFSSTIADTSKVAQPLIELAILLETIRPDNPRGWRDYAHYLHAIQPVVHAADHGDPVLVGNPLKADGLRQRKIHLVDATIQVAADGKVTKATLAPDEKSAPAAMVAPLEQALQRSAVFVPAVDHGKFVDGTYHYRLEVPPAAK